MAQRSRRPIYKYHIFLHRGLVSQRAFTIRWRICTSAHLISFSSSPAPYARLLGSAIATFDGQNTLVVRGQRHVCLLITKHAYRRINHGFMALFLIECRGEAQLSSATVRENERGVLCCWADLILPFTVRRGRGETTGMCITRRHFLPLCKTRVVVDEVVLGLDLG